MLKLWAREAEKMDGMFGVEKPLFTPNWKVGLLLSPGMLFLSPNMPAPHYDKTSINIQLMSARKIYSKCEHKYGI